MALDGLRQRGGATVPTSESDLDSMLQHHQQMQEKLADDMVHLARGMKEHAKAASNIVQDDNKVEIIPRKKFQSGNSGHNSIIKVVVANFPFPNHMVALPVSFASLVGALW